MIRVKFEFKSCEKERCSYIRSQKKWYAIRLLTHSPLGVGRKGIGQRAIMLNTKAGGGPLLEHLVVWLPLSRHRRPGLRRSHCMLDAGCFGTSWSTRRRYGTSLISRSKFLRYLINLSIAALFVDLSRTNLYYSQSTTITTMSSPFIRKKD